MKNHMQICGVDEAGRGSMLGPLVVAGITISKSKIKLLKKLGVRDSKKLSPAAREYLYKKIITKKSWYAFSAKELEACANLNEKKKIILVMLLLPLHDPYHMGASQLFAWFETMHPVFSFHLWLPPLGLWQHLCFWFL